ncbi:MAG: hypothetical protein MRK02_14120 [Candidatus Scalindua sp.]|nr:hypothetical protein [Candidatus Scalindua sp.]
MTEIRLCGRCKKSISQTDLESGLTTERYGQLICNECSHILNKKKDKGFDEQNFFFESILNEVKTISRILTYETGSWLNIIAAVAQCFVFGSLIFAYINRDGDLHSTLLLAIVFQLMALTFFVIKK